MRVDGIRRPLLAPIQPIAASRVTAPADDERFRGLVAGRLDAAYRLAAVVLGDPVEAEDATHDAVVRAWSSFGSLRDRDSFDAWFQRIVVNTCRDRMRRRRVRRSLPLGSDLPGLPAVADAAQGAPERDALARALETLDENESWLVEPTRSTENPRLLGPSIRWGVGRESFAYKNELFGPVLSVIEAADFEDALTLVNGTRYGLTAGLESLDAAEQSAFLERARAGNLYVNRPITGAVVGRQPFGGVKASSFGPGFKAGGPNTLLGLARIAGEKSPRHTVPLSRGPRVPARTPARERATALFEYGPLQSVIDDTLRDATRPEQERLARRLKSYEAAAHDELLPAHVQAEVLGFSDTFHYRPARVLLIVPKTAGELDLLSALIAAALVGAEVELAVEERHASARFRHLVPADAPRYDDPDLLAAIAGGTPYDRIRVLGPATGPAAEAAAALVRASPHLDAEPVHDSGYIELRRYTTEQSRSVALHRHGNLSLMGALERRRADRAGS